MTQIMTRLDDDTLAELDRLVSEDVFASRSDALRQGLREMLDRYRRREIGRQIAEGYKRIPQTDTEVGWADAATTAMIAEEPW
ncbi:ribbon-helix-helix domain-containing protein [Euzebya tangerina]|uniref:ribbon-helix-helix domain-containing protein n=1 Tax=Euzebya tangerina TaxID=591198 RepID=UPI000E3130AB|nr:ribbon-helix-helix domain-containing protein [Euzebya tangerina]